MIHDEICTYEVCKLAKEKGFPQDEFGVNIGYYAWDGLRKTHPLVNSFAWYNDEYNHDNLFLAPTQGLLQRWLREEKKIYIAISVDIDHDLHRVCFEYGVCYDFDGRTMEYHNSYDSFGQYEDALEDALKWTLENLV